MSRYRMIFTDNKQSKRGIMSVVLSAICFLSFVYSLVVSYKNDGNVPNSFGAALVLTLVMAVVGLALGISALRDVSKFRAIPMVGTIVNLVMIIILGFVLWVGLN